MLSADEQFAGLAGRGECKAEAEVGYCREETIHAGKKPCSECRP